MIINTTEYKRKIWYKIRRLFKRMTCNHELIMVHNDNEWKPTCFKCGLNIK